MKISYDTKSDMHNGTLITFEGIEGAGKSTQIKKAAAWLVEQHIPVVLTREPGGTVVAEMLRNILIQEKDEIVTPTTELLILFAARAQHMAHVILPALQAGKVVLCDRFIDATYAYQGGGRQLPRAWIDSLSAIVLQEITPTLTVLFDLPVEVGLQRARARTGSYLYDRFESEEISFHQRVRDGYLAQKDSDPSRFAVLDATLPENELALVVRSMLLPYIQPFIPYGDTYRLLGCLEIIKRNIIEELFEGNKQ